MFNLWRRPSKVYATSYLPFCIRNNSFTVSFCLWVTLDLFVIKYSDVSPSSGDTRIDYAAGISKAVANTLGIVIALRAVHRVLRYWSVSLCDLKITDMRPSGVATLKLIFFIGVYLMCWFFRALDTFSPGFYAFWLTVAVAPNALTDPKAKTGFLTICDIMAVFL